MIAAERDRVAAATAFASELARTQSEWDVIRLNYLAPKSVAASTLRDALDRLGFRTRSIAAPGNQFIALDSSWESYYASRSRRLKKANNLAANRVAKAGEVRIDWLQPDVDGSIAFTSFLDRAISVSAKSWKTHTGNSLDNPGPSAFIRRLSELASQCGWLSIWILSVNDRPLAMEYQLVANGYVHGLRSDFDAAFDEISPGTYLNRCLIERLFGHGLRRYYLGPGDNPYKRRWADHVEPLEELTAYGRSLAGRSLSAWEITLKPLATKLRARLRPPPSDESDDHRD
jgi:CelD/BcsL family acetyltransferase involved in cellulose biosynthesis